MGTKRAMTGWYDPAQLAQTGIRVAISTVFGQFADKREAFAAANAISPQPYDGSFDYSAKAGADGFWLDFVADTGDGWNSTYAVARLLAAPSLTPGDVALPRGQVLMMGGDQVYPTASRDEYDDRLLAPFEAAHAAVATSGGWPEGEDRPDVYAIPGNHDWYDGLNAFFGLFCRRRIAPANGIGMDREGRVIAGRQTHQTRSYFALRLPGDWWLWGTDSQLEGYIDQPQIEYFMHVARYWMAKGSKLILCVGSPSWEYVDKADPDDAFANFSYLERLAGAATDEAGEPMGHRLRLVMTGDSHHYVRYVEGDRHYVTCGGGGAFLHPTHQVEDKDDFTSEYPPPGVAYKRGDPRTPRDFRIARDAAGTPALYPSAATSRRLTFWNLLFAFKNPKFPLLLAPAYALFIWILDFDARVTTGHGLGTALAAGGLWDAVQTYWRLVTVSPLGPLLVGGALGGYYYFADVKNGLGRLAVGGLHALASAAAVTLTTCVAARWTATVWQDAPVGVLAVLGKIGLIAVAGGASAIASATTFGLYLLISLLVFRRHWNEAFSSIGHRGYKGFLRIRIDAGGTLTVHPIGLTKVPFDRGRVPRDPPLSPHLIEPPFEIR